jgi:hypothetical protein
MTCRSVLKCDDARLLHSQPKTLRTCLAVGSISLPAPHPSVFAKNPATLIARCTSGKLTLWKRAIRIGKKVWQCTRPCVKSRTRRMNEHSTNEITSVSEYGFRCRAQDEGPKRRKAIGTYAAHSPTEAFRKTRGSRDAKTDRGGPCIDALRPLWSLLRSWPLLALLEIRGHIIPCLA